MEEVFHMTGRARRRFAASLALSLLLLVAAACGQEGSPAEPVRSPGSDVATLEAPALSEMARLGETLFNTSCSACHGQRAVGSEQGPPLLDRVYHPGHHADAAIRLAVLRGAPAHHWGFGDMPPVSGVSTEEVEQIICYVRELQRAEGLFAGDAFQTVC